MKSLLTVLASLAVATAPSGDAPRLLRVDVDTAALSAQPSSCFRATTPEQGFTWGLRADERGGSVLELGAPSFELGDAGRVALPHELSGDARFSFQSFQARVEGGSLVTRRTEAEVILTPGETVWTGTLTLSARDGCREGTCQRSCEVRLPFTATPVNLSLAHAAR